MRKWGNSMILSFTAEECNVRDLKVGDEVNVELEQTGRNHEEGSKKSIIGLMSPNDSPALSPEIIKEAMKTAAKLMPGLLNPEAQVKEYDITAEAQEQPKTLLQQKPISLKQPKMAEPETSQGEEVSGDVDFNLYAIIDEAPTEIANIDPAPKDIQKKRVNILPVEKEVSEEKQEKKSKADEVFKMGEDGQWKPQN